MGEESRVSRARCEADDRLSNLPDSVLCHILSFLPTKFSAATALLSTRWRYLFLDVPKIDLDESLILNPDLNRDEDDGIDEKGRLILEEQFTCILRNGLQSHKSPIKEFRVTLLDQNQPKVDLVEAWICSPLCRNVEVVEIFVKQVRVKQARKSENFTHISYEIFRFKPLVVLKLQGRFVIQLPKSELSWLPNLKVLSFSGHPNFREGWFFSDRKMVVTGDNTGWEIGVSCPLLEDLEFSHVFFSQVGLINISIPSLKKLVLVVMDCGSRVVLNTPNLEYSKYDCFLSPVIDSAGKMKNLVRADLCFRYVNGDEIEKLCRFFNEIYNVKFLRIQGYYLKRDVANYMLRDFQNLTHLEILGCKRDNWDLVETLLKSAPKLEILVCDMENDGFDIGRELDYSLYDKPRCLDAHLTEVEVKNYGVRKYDFQLVSYFLNHGSVLQKMSICLFERGSKKWRTRMNKKLLKIRRCSKHCQVVLG